MTRKEIALEHINKNGTGIEIGPSHNPLAPKKEGFNAEIIDHLNADDLKSKFREHDVEIENIEDVDYVWNGEKYSDLTGRKNFYDWIIASHVIEHTPDLIDFINNCDSILKEDGVLSLIIPDKRYCFDHFRPVTSLSKVIDAHLNENQNHTPGSVAEFYLNTVKKEDQIAWGAGYSGDYELLHSFEDALGGLKSRLHTSSYVDVHAWCFVPHSFRLLIDDLNKLGFISLKEIAFHPTQGCEFYVTLGRSGKNIDKPRLEMLQVIENEIKAETFVDTKPPKTTNRIRNRARSLLKRFVKK